MPCKSWLVQHDKNFYASLKDKAENLKSYAAKNHYDTTHCFLVDYSIPSGTPRFFIWNFTTEKIEYADYCMHGPGGSCRLQAPGRFRGGCWWLV